MSLTRLQKAQEREAKREEVLRCARERQQQFEAHFWSDDFPILANRVRQALSARGIESKWSEGSHSTAGQHTLTLPNVGEMLYLKPFSYWINCNAKGRLSLDYKCYDSFARDSDSISHEPPSVSIRVVVNEKHLPIAFTIATRAVARLRGDYRFRWYGENDTTRTASSLLSILDGRRPSSDFNLGGPCFIASAIYGPCAAETETLRSFRDRHLAQHAAGRSFVRAYYLLSPFMAAIIYSHPLLRRVAAHLLGPVVRAAARMSE